VDDGGLGLTFDESAGLLKALGHPLRLRLVCGLCRQPSNLTRIGAALGAPLSTVALHLAVLRRAGVLEEQRTGSEISFPVRDARVLRILESLCQEGGGRPPAQWGWDELARDLGQPMRPGAHAGKGR
jgi:ArsR family transcriptional regulator